MTQTAPGKKPPEPAYHQCKAYVCITNLIAWGYRNDPSITMKGAFWNNSDAALTNVTLTFEAWNNSLIVEDGTASIRSIPAHTQWNFAAPLEPSGIDMTKARPSRISFSVGDQFIDDTLDFEALCLVRWNIWQRHPCGQ
jgi:hypothetical protein